MSEAKDLLKRLCEVHNEKYEVQNLLPGWKGVIQFVLDGEEFYVEFKGDGTVEFKEGTHPSPTVRIVASPEFWLKVMKGEEDPLMGAVTGKYKLEGAMAEAPKLAAYLRKAIAYL